MRYKLLAALVFISCGLQAQQVNPVPDYVFQNRMSVGRTTVTDTLAYFSMGPRYGATRGFMPPMVVDTALITGGTKRNGLTIFSIQKNKYMYWDSVRVQWSDFAGSSGAYIFASDTASMLSPYLRAAGYGVTKSGQTISVDTAAMATRARVQKGIDSLGAVKGPGTVTSVSAGTGMSFTTITSTGSVAADTTVLSTRAWRRKGLDSLAALELSISDTSNMLSQYIRAAGFGLTKSGQSLLVDSATMATRARVQKGIDSVAGLARVTGSGSTNYVPKFTGSTALGNSQIFDNGTNVGIGTASPQSTLEIGGASSTVARVSTQGGTSLYRGYVIGNTTTDALEYGSFKMELGGGELRIASGFSGWGGLQTFYTNGSERMRIKTDGELLLNTNVDAGAYALQVAGSIYNTTGAVFAASSGNVGIGTTSTSGTKLRVLGSDADFRIIDGYASSTPSATIISQTGKAISITAGLNGTALFIDTTSYFSITKAPKTDFTGNNIGVSGTELLRILSSGNMGLGTSSPSERLHVSGRARITTIDSSSSPMNMLWADANGVIQKTAVPSGGVSGSGTTNYVAKFTGSTAVGNSQIFDNGTNVGIGTTSPSLKLDIVGTSDINMSIQTTSSGVNANAGIRLQTATEGFYTIQTGNAVSGGLRIYDAVANAERLRINSSGELLIGTTTDAGAYALQVAGSIYNTTGAVLAASSGNVGIGTTSPAQKLDVNGNAIVSGFGSFGRSVDGTYRLVVRGQGTTSASYGLGVQDPNGVNLFVVRDDGNVGIGTASPSERLHVSGRARITTIDSSSSPMNMLWADANGVIQKTAVPSGGVSGSGTTNYVAKFTGSTAVGNSVIYESSSKIGIGTTNPSTFLHVKGANGAQIDLDNAGEQYSGINISNNGSRKAFIQHNNTANALYIGSDANDIDFYTNGSPRMRVSSAGNIGLGTSSPSYRLDISGELRSTSNTYLATNSSEVYVGTTSDAGAYGLQVVNNAYVSGKLDVSSNTTNGLTVTRSGTSASALTVGNAGSTAYLMSESSIAGVTVTGSLGYAALVGNAANEELQFFTNNTVRATFVADGDFLINSVSDQGSYKVQLNGNMYVYGASGNSITMDSTEIYMTNVKNRSSLNVASFSNTGSNANAALNISGTWNTTGNINLINSDITNTASG
ncbi:hypothetical protein EBZ39_06775, partial [bacterium]|nr:hypothetical protein [bacterium]